MKISPNREGNGTSQLHTMLHTLIIKVSSQVASGQKHKIGGGRIYVAITASACVCHFLQTQIIDEGYLNSIDGEKKISYTKVANEVLSLA